MKEEEKSYICCSLGFVGQNKENKENRGPQLRKLNQSRRCPIQPSRAHVISLPS